MVQLADYKVLGQAATELTSIGDAHRIDFDLPGGALLVDGPQRPFFTFNVGVTKGLPTGYDLTLNGTLVDSVIWATTTIEVPLNRTVAVIGSQFASGQNSLIFTLTSTNQSGGLWSVMISDVIVHFQQVA